MSAAGRTGVAARAEEFARRRFGPKARVEHLAGDASDRTFFRLRAGPLAPLVLMVHAEPFELATLPWFLHARFLHRLGAAVPQIVASYPSDGILVVQDLGDETLQAHLTACDEARRRLLYLQAVQIIVFLQQEGTRALEPDLPAATTALDRERLLWELRYFAQHYAGGLLGSPLSPARSRLLDDWFADLAGTVAGYPAALCHRDYHSRNLMVKGERLYMVDFQDARMGPDTYDLASLVRDSYVDLPDALRAEMIDFFLEASASGRGGPGGPPDSREEFLERFNRTGLQRNIKALGTFASQAVLRGNTVYLKYVLRTLQLVRNALRLEGASDILDLFTGPLDYRP